MQVTDTVKNCTLEKCAKCNSKNMHATCPTGGMARKGAVIPLVFFAMLAVPPVFYPDYVQYSWWLFYEAVVNGKFYDRCWWPDDFMDRQNTAHMHDFEYDEDLECYLKRGSD